MFVDGMKAGCRGYRARGVVDQTDDEHSCRDSFQRVPLSPSRRDQQSGGKRAHNHQRADGKGFREL